VKRADLAPSDTAKAASPQPSASPTAEAKPN
jgi:hypothetical protein